MYLVKLRQGDDGPWLAFTHAGPIWVTDKAYAETYTWLEAFYVAETIIKQGPMCWIHKERHANSNPN